MKLHPKAKLKGKIEIDDKKVITGEARLSYPALFEAKEFKGKKSWGCQLLFSKELNLSALEIAAQNAAIEKWGKDPANWPSKKIKSKKTGKIINKCLVKMPFRDGDEERPDKPEYEGMIFVGASNKKNAPSICDQKLRPIIDSSDIKAGDYVRASLIAFAYEDEGSAGVSFALMNLQKLRTGEGFGGGRSAAEEFDEVESEEEDEDENEEDENEEESEDESEDEDEEEEEEEEEEVKPKKKTSSKKVVTKKKARY